MKKSIAISLFAIMLYNIAGYYAVYNVLNIQVKKHVWKLQKGQIPDADLLAFSPDITTDADFEWVKEHEFRYRGNLYDIIRKTETTNSVVWYCIQDEREQEMLTHLKQQVHQNNGHPAKNAKLLIKSIVKDYIVEMPAFVHVSALQIAHSTYFICLFLSPDLTQESPPPRVS
ncbi:MAG: hypothetical protein WC150_11080 [Bacteroidia bacterium]